MCKHFGANIIATTGTEEKKIFLRDVMHLQHVFDSRSPAFASAVKVLTNHRGVGILALLLVLLII